MAKHAARARPAGRRIAARTKAAMVPPQSTIAGTQPPAVGWSLPAATTATIPLSHTAAGAAAS